MLKVILFILFFPITFPIWLLSKLFTGNNNNTILKNNHKDIELEKEMDKYELEPWQKDLVRKGQYDPKQFDTDDDDIEEKDYYEEDNQ